MLLTVLLDTTRHAGHSDIVRELIDGTTGDRDSPSGFYGTRDEEYRSNYLARVRGEIDTPSWWALHPHPRQEVELTGARMSRVPLNLAGGPG